jgi:hypothetical protein
MAKKFAELEANMSPESRARSEALYQAMRIALLPKRDEGDAADEGNPQRLQNQPSAALETKSGIARASRDNAGATTQIGKQDGSGDHVLSSLCSPG